MRYDAFIYDERDRDSDEPTSYIGEYDTLEEAHTAIEKWLAQVPIHSPYVYKTEVVKK